MPSPRPEVTPGTSSRRHHSNPWTRIGIVYIKSEGLGLEVFAQITFANTHALRLS